MKNRETATLVDSHCHLPQLIDAGGGPLEAILQRAKEAGVSRMLSASVDLESFPRLLDISARHDEVHISAGIHPNHNSVLCEDESVSLAKYAEKTRVIGIGETGLDYFHKDVERPVQIRRFREHIRVARTVNKPLIVHMRDSSDDVFRILEEERAEDIGGVMHCFSGSIEEARIALELGFYLSFSGIITFKTATELRAVATEIPLSRLLIETDSPWLAPVPYRGKRNEPAFVLHVAEVVARCRGLSLDQIAGATTENFNRLFRLN